MSLESLAAEVFEEIEAGIEQTTRELDEILHRPGKSGDWEQLEEREREIRALCNQLGDLVAAWGVQEALLEEELKEEAIQLTGSCSKPMQVEGARRVAVQFSGGTTIRVATLYFRRKGKKRKHQKNGFYPGLVVLGIYERCSPLLAQEIALFATAASSLEEASGFLKEQGIDVEIGRIRTVSRCLAEQARLAREAGQIEGLERVSGCRVVVSTDGGRIRIRRNLGARTQKGRRRYSTRWREPKLLIIYVVDEEGKMAKHFAPLIDGTLKGPDAVFGLLEFYLSKLAIQAADKVLFVADGARWIWTRVAKLATSLGLGTGQFYELVDLYHAVQHLATVAGFRKQCTSGRRKAWITLQRKRLLQGAVENVIAAVQEICRGRRGKEIARERDYFVRNAPRMNYAVIAGEALPLGSGAMESAIRRVVNLRLKGPAIFWRRENAEDMLMLRSFYKAGRWNLLKKMAFSTAIPVVP